MVVVGEATVVEVVLVDTGGCVPAPDERGSAVEGTGVTVVPDIATVVVGACTSITRATDELGAAEGVRVDVGAATTVVDVVVVEVVVVLVVVVVAADVG